MSINSEQIWQMFQQVIFILSSMLWEGSTESTNYPWWSCNCLHSEVIDQWMYVIKSGEESETTKMALLPPSKLMLLPSHHHFITNRFILSFHWLLIHLSTINWRLFVLASVVNHTLIKTGFFLQVRPLNNWPNGKLRIYSDVITQDENQKLIFQRNRTIGLSSPYKKTYYYRT